MAQNIDCSSHVLIYLYIYICMSMCIIYIYISVSIYQIYVSTYAFACVYIYIYAQTVVNTVFHAKACISKGPTGHLNIRILQSMHVWDPPHYLGPQNQELGSLSSRGLWAPNLSSSHCGATYTLDSMEPCHPDPPSSYMQALCSQAPK